MHEFLYVRKIIRYSVSDTVHSRRKMLEYSLIKKLLYLPLYPRNEG